MTEAEWLAATDILGLLRNLPEYVSARKTRLALCACLQSPRVWLFVVSKKSRRAVAVSEQYAEGRFSAKELRLARADAVDAWTRIGPSKPCEYAAAELAHDACWLDPKLRRVGLVTLQRLAQEGNLAIPAIPFRDIFGNPFRPVAFSSEWLTDTAVALARRIYESREFSAMPILADALQDAGCEDEQILSHCRGDGPHVRGCWVVDLVLGKE